MTGISLKVVELKKRKLVKFPYSLFICLRL